MDVEIFKSNLRVMLIAIAVFGFFGVWMLNVPSGPKAEVSGFVEVAGMDASSKYRLPRGVVKVRLKTGETVSATVLPGVVALSGDQVLIRVYERILTKAPVYEVYAKSNDTTP